ncbi:MAG: hypothetical protein R3F19_24530 [Verrucomicrobiales bacterium]
MRGDSLFGIGNQLPSPWKRIWQWCRDAIAAGVLIALPAEGTDQGIAGSIAYLNEQGVAVSIESDDADIAEALRPLLIDDATLKLARAQLADLRADDYRDREAASRELARLAFPIDPLLVTSGKSSAWNEEFTWRLQQILAVRRPLALEDPLHHALVIIAEKPVRGLIAELLASASALESGDAQLLAALENAIVATVSLADTPILQSQLQPEHSISARKRTTMALAALTARAGAAELKQLLTANDPELQLASAKGAVLAGNDGGIPVLVSLLESSSTAIRCEAAELLYKCTGEDFGFAGYDDPLGRAASVKRWRDWLTAGGRIHPPVAEPAGRVIVGIQLKEPPASESGRARGQKAAIDRSNVIEFTPSGSLRWHMHSVELRGGTAIASIPMHSGARAIAFGIPGQMPQQSMSIRFFDKDSRGIGSLTGLAGMPTLALSSSGNLLLAAANEIVEVECAGTLVRRTAFGTFSDTIDHFSLIHGNRVMIVSSASGTVREYSLDGELLIEKDQLDKPYYARRGRDGSLLVAQRAQGGSAIVSFTAEGKRQWTFSPSNDIGQMSAVAALSNGHALLGSSTGLYEIASSGQIIRTWINGAVNFIYAD